MRKLHLVILTLALCLPSIALQAPVSAKKPRHKDFFLTDPSTYAPGEVVVKLKEGARHFALPDGGEHLMTVARSIGERAGRMRERAVEPLALPARNKRLNEILARRGLDRTFVLRFDPEADMDSIIAELKSDEEVEYAHPNYRVKPGSIIPDDPNFNKQWALRNLGIGVQGRASKLNADIKATEAWEITTGDPDLIVAVSDSGVDIDHPDLAASIYVNEGEIPGNGIDDDKNGYIDDVNGFNVADQNGDISDALGHGTQMAGIIAARLNNQVGISGIAQVKILPVRFFFLEDPDDPFSFEATIVDAARSLIYSIAAGASIINASWTVLFPDALEGQALEDAVKATNDAGILLVCIAGNDGFNNDVSKVYPGAYGLPNQIVVAASDFNDDIWRFGFFIKSGFGEKSVHLTAPGISVFTISARGNCVLCSESDDPDEWYEFVDGTSASAAVVSGVAALVKSRYPEDYVTLIKRRILDGVDKLDSLLDPQGRPYVATGGRLNAVGALTVEPDIAPPVLTSFKFKAKKGKLFLFGAGVQPGAVVLVGDTAYPVNPKSGDKFLARVPQSEFPPDSPVEIKLRNPDGGISQILIVTR
ncbi:MAG: S8 family serine peptidase [Blastocatellia bacterium]|nr:S8 family serine peptidase [Blastocatellia bacterium]